MELSDFVGYPLEFVKKELDSQGLKFVVIESSDIQKKHDTILVTKISKKNDIIEIVTDKFLLNI